ncbi:MAG: hypothetical protein KME17_11625 [Cyanosarcina radialis HA8281-LM2]|jgi:hypothetical protein|nr:hypothetical protein [Cyanosarcina radialis HA8281-LM2]
MSNIEIADLQVSGSDLFVDDESYLTELDHSSLLASQIQGGSLASIVVVTVVTFTAVSIATRISREILEPDCPPPPPPFCE